MPDEAEDKLPTAETRKLNALPLVAIVLAGVFWFLDAYVSGTPPTSADDASGLAAPGVLSIGMRTLVSLLLIGFAFYARALLAAQVRTSHSLNQYRTNLERRVEERTQQLGQTRNELRDALEKRKSIEDNLQYLSTTDSLTQVFNRRKFEEMIEHEIERDRRYQCGLSLLVCDVDRLGDINERHGREIGDATLKIFAEMLRSAIRKSDIFARWGGGEFVLLISDTNPQYSGMIAEKLRKLVESSEFPVAGRITASFGVANFDREETPLSLVERAQSALLRAKLDGPSRIAIAGNQELEIPAEPDSI